MRKWRVNRGVVASILSLVLCMSNVQIVGAVGAELHNEAITAPQPYRVGETVQFRVTCLNSNTITATAVMVQETLPDGSVVSLANNITMGPNETREWNVNYVVRAEDVKTQNGFGGSFMGISAVARFDGRVNGQRYATEAEALAAVIQPAIDIATTVDFNNDGTFGESESNYVGEDATWRVLVKNTGDARVENIQVTDNLGHTYEGFSLDAGAERVFEFTEAMNANKVLTATAQGVDQQGRSVGPVSDPAQVKTFKADYTIEKLVDFNRDGDFHDREGGFTDTRATWKLVVKNTGDLNLTSMMIDDSFGMDFGPFNLQVGEEQVFTYSTNISSDVTNTASVRGFDENERVVTEKSDSAGVRTLIPGIEIEKTASPQVILAGEPVTYTYRVKNTSEFQLDRVVVTDDRLGYIGTTGSLAANEEATVSTTTAIYVDTVNTGLATGHYWAGPEDSRVITETSQASVNVVNPAVKITKTSDAEGPVEIGSVVTYTYLVENTGDTPLVGLEVTDDKIPAFRGLIPHLGVNQSASVEATAAIYEDTTNVGTVEGTDEFQHPVSDTDTETVETLVGMPDMALIKSVDSTTAIPGQLLTYTLTYQNVGTAPTQSGFVIADDFDERYVDVVDAAGGTVVDGTIAWLFLDNLAPADGPRTITYTVRVKDEVTMPTGLTDVLNVALVDTPGDINEDNDADDETVVVENDFLPFDEEETPTASADTDQPFLPYTGMELLTLGLAALLTGSVGATLRRSARRHEEG